MDWTIEQSDVLYQGSPDLHTYPDSKVLYRSDTLAPLSVVSQRYNVVQPHEVLHFYQDLVEAGVSSWRPQAHSKVAVNFGLWLRPART